MIAQEQKHLREQSEALERFRAELTATVAPGVRGVARERPSGDRYC